MKLVTTALELSYMEALKDVHPKHLEMAAEQLTLRSDKIHVVDAQNPKKEEEREKQKSREEPEESKPKGQQEEKRGRKQRAPEEPENPKPK